MQNCTERIIAYKQFISTERKDTFKYTFLLRQLTHTPRVQTMILFGLEPVSPAHDSYLPHMALFKTIDTKICINLAEQGFYQQVVKLALSIFYGIRGNDCAITTILRHPQYQKHHQCITDFLKRSTLICCRPHSSVNTVQNPLLKYSNSK